MVHAGRCQPSDGGRNRQPAHAPFPAHRCRARAAGRTRYVPEAIMTRAEHIAWAKERALEYLPDRPDLAVASIVTDLTNHEATCGEAVGVGLRLAPGLWDRDRLADLRAAIEELS